MSLKYFIEHQRSIRNIYQLHSVISQYLQQYTFDIEITECCVEQSYIPNYSDCSFAIIMKSSHIIICDPSYTSFGKLQPHNDAYAYIIYVCDKHTQQFPIYHLTEIIQFIQNKKIEIPTAIEKSNNATIKTIKMSLMTPPKRHFSFTIPTIIPPYFDLNDCTSTQSTPTPLNTPISSPTPIYSYTEYHQDIINTLTASL
jgi:hypothetical protein